MVSGFANQGTPWETHEVAPEIGGLVGIWSDALRLIRFRCSEERVKAEYLAQLKAAQHFCKELPVLSFGSATNSCQWKRTADANVDQAFLAKKDGEIPPSPLASVQSATPAMFVAVPPAHPEPLSKRFLGWGSFNMFHRYSLSWLSR